MQNGLLYNGTYGLDLSSGRIRFSDRLDDLLVQQQDKIVAESITNMVAEKADGASVDAFDRDAEKFAQQAPRQLTGGVKNRMIVDKKMPMVASFKFPRRR